MIVTIGRICLLNNLLQGNGNGRKGLAGGNDHINADLIAGLVGIAVIKFFPQLQIPQGEASGHTGFCSTAKKLAFQHGFGAALVNGGNTDNRQGIVGGDGSTL